MTEDTIIYGGMKHCTGHNTTFPSNTECPECKGSNTTFQWYDVTPGIDHFKDIPAEERTGSADYSLSMLCRQDKEQLDRIEKMLTRLFRKKFPFG